MRMPLRLALSLMPIVGWLQAQTPATPLPAAASPSPDPLLETLLREAFDRNPDLARTTALQAAERERVPQARALPDPTVSVGMQNDGFRKNEVGTMDTSYYQVMVSQSLPWPGKRALRADVARLGEGTAASANLRARLTLEADVRRAYAGLLLNREQARLLEEQAGILRQAEVMARARYGVGQGSQADCFRAQLELTRLAQTRLTLHAGERTLVGQLNRLRARPLATPIPTSATLDALPAPRPVDPGEAERLSPELQSARQGIAQAERSLDLARLDSRPDFAITAGLMPRGGLDPMWTASVGISVPLWRGQKQHRAVAEQEQRRQAQGSEARSVQNQLAQRMEDRAAELEAVNGSLRLYREGLLAQSEGSFRATLAQYEAGLAPFLAVLEALNGWIADRSGYLQTQAQAQAVLIASAELQLGPTPPIGAGLPGASVGGVGATAPPKAADAPAKGQAPDSGAPSMSTM